MEMKKDRKKFKLNTFYTFNTFKKKRRMVNRVT